MGKIGDILKKISFAIGLIAVILLGFFLIALVVSKITGIGILESLGYVGGIFITSFLLSGISIVGGFIVYSKNPKIGRVIIYMGLFGIIITLGMFELGLLASEFKAGVPEYQQCKDEDYNFIKIVGRIDKTNIFFKDSLNFISCIGTGYKANNLFEIITLFIVGIVAPFIILIPIFVDFIQASGMIQNQTSQKLIGWGFGLMAYRGFIVTKLVYILEYGAMGIALIVINFIFLGGIFSYIRKSLEKYAPLEMVMQYGSITKMAKENLTGSLKTMLQMSESEMKEVIEEPEFRGLFIELGMKAQYALLLAAVLHGKDPKLVINEILKQLEK